MTDRLTVYNMALGHLRERRLGSLTENREPRRVLDDFWDQVVDEALAEGLWNFLIRAVEADPSTTIVPSFGWDYAFVTPPDWVRTVVVSSVETFNPPLLDYMEETGVWYSNVKPLYIRYVSNDPQYGRNLGGWTAYFTKYVSLLLAEYGCGRITGNTDLLKGPDGISNRLRSAKIKAKSNDAMNQPPGQTPTGTWARSRRGFLRGVTAPNGSAYDDR